MFSSTSSTTKHVSTQILPPSTSKTTGLTLGSYTLPSIHNWPPFFTQQLRNPTVQAQQAQLWTRLILSYARHRRIFYLSIQDAEQRTGTEWSDIIFNPRIGRILKRQHLQDLMKTLVANGDAAYEPEKQTESVLLYWKRPEQWAETIHEWVTTTGQLNIILTFYELIEPEVPSTSPLTGLPLSLLKKSLSILTKSGRAQIIDGHAVEGGGVRFFAR